LGVALSWRAVRRVPRRGRGSGRVCSLETALSVLADKRIDDERRGGIVTSSLSVKSG
jgi:hypothetical protein